MQATAETRIRVRYAETDQMGVVYYSNYLVWMEVGRVEFCRTRGFSYRDMERDDGILLAVAEANCRYRYPARYDDEVIVKTSLKEANRRIVTFVYEITAADSGRILADGTTRHVFLDREMRLTRLPEKYFGLFGLLCQALSNLDQTRGEYCATILASRQSCAHAQIQPAVNVRR